MKDGIIEGKQINLGAILSLMALLLVVSICIALYLGANEEIEIRPPAEGEVVLSEMEDYLNKLTLQVPPRNLKTKNGQQALRSVAAMIDGTLGPSNIGFPIEQKTDAAEDLLWRTIWIEAGNLKSKKVVLLSIPYGESGHTVAFALGFGEYLTKHKPDYQLKLVFSPPLEPINSTWLRNHIVEKEESLAGIIHLHTLSGDAKWATVRVAEDSNLGNKVKKSMADLKWNNNLNFQPTESPTEIQIGLHLDDRSPQEGTAQRFLRMIPVVKKIADLMAN